MQSGDFAADGPAIVHASAPVKALLSHLPQELVTPYLNADLVAYTPTTVTTKSDLVAQLRESQTQGYAVEVSEHIEGCHGVAVPVFDGDGEAVLAVAGQDGYIWYFDMTGSVHGTPSVE